MKINSTNLPKKFFIPIVILLLIGLAAGFYIFFIRPTQEHDTSTKGINSVNYSKPTNDQIKEGSNIKQASAGKPNGSSGTDTPPAPTPQSGSTKSVVQLSITYSAQDSSTYHIRALINSVINTGTCTLLLTKNSTTLKYSSGIQANSTTSTCQGFDIPLNPSNLTTGTWQLGLTFDNTNLTGSINQTIQVK